MHAYAIQDQTIWQQSIQSSIDPIARYTDCVPVVTLYAHYTTPLFRSSKNQTIRKKCVERKQDGRGTTEHCWNDPFSCEAILIFLHSSRVNFVMEDWIEKKILKMSFCRVERIVRRETDKMLSWRLIQEVNADMF